MMTKFTFVLWFGLSVASILAGSSLICVHSVSAAEIQHKGIFIMTYDFGVAQPYARSILSAAEKHNLEPELIAAVIIKESCVASAPYYIDGIRAVNGKPVKGRQVAYRCIRLNPYAVGNVGERGLMQIRPYHVRNPDMLWNTDYNIHTGTRLLREIIDYKGNLYTGLLGYNAGPYRSVYYNQKYANDILLNAAGMKHRRKSVFAIAR